MIVLVYSGLLVLCVVCVCHSSRFSKSSRLFQATSVSINNMESIGVPISIISSSEDYATIPRVPGIAYSEEAVAPLWFQELRACQNTRPVIVKEWTDERWRNEEGNFLGRDFCHSRHASVRILDYLIIAPTEADAAGDIEPNLTAFPKLVGPAYFSQRCESHKGLCHGGSFCALMDDAIGWLGFCVSGEVKPWSGFTVQVNTSLKKSVRVGSTLRLEAFVDRKEGLRKHWIHARLVDPDNGDVHCEAEGLFLLNPKDSGAEH